MSNKLEILSLYGFRRDPFHGVEIESADASRVKNLISMAVSAHAQISIVGERGIGKTRAVNTALRGLNINPVRILTPDKTRVTAADIQEALLIELVPDEKVRQDREIRIRQLRRVLGEASKRGAVVVVIDEAHRLHGNTLRSLKNLRELAWMGETHLFTVVLIGQSDSTQKMGMSEVRLRTEVVQMHGLTAAEIGRYVMETVGNVFTEDAIDALAGIQDARNYLDLQELLVHAMANAIARGAEKVEAKDVGDRPNERAETISKSGSGAKQNALKSVMARKRAVGAN
ncbi:MAG: ATP-binding protein [Syntrophobacteraceae bacterium]|jgi:type II secretory pathway predicted ATPase ExeA